MSMPGELHVKAYVKDEIKFHYPLLPDRLSDRLSSTVVPYWGVAKAYTSTVKLNPKRYNPYPALDVPYYYIVVPTLVRAKQMCEYYDLVLVRDFKHPKSLSIDWEGNCDPNDIVYWTDKNEARKALADLKLIVADMRKCAPAWQEIDDPQLYSLMIKLDRGPVHDEELR